MSTRMPVVMMTWTESESGWGQRPDGISIHLTVEDCKTFQAAYWEEERKRNPSGVTPAEYTRPDDNPTVIDVDQALYARLAEKRLVGVFGIRAWGDEEKMIRRSFDPDEEARFTVLLWENDTSIRDPKATKVKRPEAERRAKQVEALGFKVTIAPGVE